MEKISLRISMVLLSLVSLMHLVRLLWKMEVMIAGVHIPFWVSAVGFAIPAFLVLGLSRALQKL